MSKVNELLNFAERSRQIVSEIMKFGVNEECIARVIQGLAMESEDPEFVIKIMEITKSKITSLQSLQNNENTNKVENKKIIL